MMNPEVQAHAVRDVATQAREWCQRKLASSDLDTLRAELRALTMDGGGRRRG